MSAELPSRIPGAVRDVLLKAGPRTPEGRFYLGSLFVLAVIYMTVAAAGFHGFYTKWLMHDLVPQRSLISMLDGTADRPFVFRQLLPQLATWIDAALPESLRAAIEHRMVTGEGGLKAPLGAEASLPGYVIRYRLVYYFTFLSLFLALFVLRALCLDLGLNEPAATAAPALFALMLPILQTRGGYFYDLPELLTLALAAKFALAGRIIPLLVLAPIAAMNKEAFFFYCLTLLPLLMVHLPRLTAGLTALGAMGLAGLSYLAIRLSYADNGGQNAFFQLFDNLAFYGNPRNLFLFDQTYGLPLFKGYGVVIMGWFAILMVYGWRTVPRYIHQHLALTALINVPLLLLFCAEGEMRNLSMLYIAIILLMAGALHRWLNTVMGTARAADAPRPELVQTRPAIFTN